ncbi:hypothetical protein [Adhaeribacter soli]|uniref:Lipoprotein n=1 Tax=Adhaeribacter soli TaxID=2607655 RepID=A0A5N1J564_9BACT|nr:hypothetical protein [Adhaeribacter soli]KAA9340219.1 hypothetical protein F0P94_07680 [Adhaeribacter soli]
MEKLLLHKLGMLALAGTLVFSGCRNTDKEDAAPEESLASAEDNARIETEMETLHNMVEADAAERFGAPGQQVAAGVFAPCVTRTWDAATKTLTIDFGSVNCLCKDGAYRRGKIIAVFNGPWRTAGSTVTITLNNYFVNNNQHSGTRLVTNLSNETETSVNYKYRVEVQNAAIAFTDGTTRNWNALREVERVAGQGTATILDDEYLVSGTSSGTNRRGVQFTTTTGQPLRKVFRPGCFRNFISGTVTITNSKQKSMLLNYDPTGTGACDKTASVTVNGKTRTITLR